MRWSLGFATLLASQIGSHAFAPNPTNSRRSTTVQVATEAIASVKPTGTSFLPDETVERAKSGSPVEKVKLEKDGTSAFIDVYEYARKIREGEMTWEEVDKADLDTVRDELVYFQNSAGIC
jgi:hypothetical protein